MVIKCKYDIKRDLMEVVPDLSINLSKALETGVVVDVGTMPEYNDISDPTSVICRVRDSFDAYHLQKQIFEAGKKTDVSNQ